MADRKIAELTELEATGARTVRLEVGGEWLELFLVQDQGRVYGYFDHCPHTGAPLCWREHVYLDSSGTEIVCATHDARFEISSGRCLAGPCIGDRLQPAPIRVVDEAVYFLDGAGTDDG